MIEVNSPRLLDLVAEDAAVEQICTGFQFTEGPIWHPVEQCLYFSDIPADIRRRWSAADGVSEVRSPNDKGNGMTLDADLNLYICEHVTSALIRETPSGERQVLASHYDGKELNSPNDIIVKSDGSIYFSDPSFGRMEYYGVPREQDLDFQGLYRLDPESGELRLLASDFDQPNGLCFSLDESMLFVNDTMTTQIRVFDVDADGGISNGRVWAELTGDLEGVADGMKIDSQGNLFSTGPGGIQCFAPDATSLGVILMPEGVSNFIWGDEDLRSLFITASTSLYRVRVKTPGRKVF
jgi:gluconolactonase